MSVKIPSPLSTEAYLKRYGGFYRQILANVSSFQELGNRLVQLAEQARAFRQDDLVKEAAQALASIPLRDYQAIGQYFLGLYQHRKGADAKRIFEQVAENAPAKYRAWAMHSLAAIDDRAQDYASELNWLFESSKLYPAIETVRAIAVVKAKEGYHRQALIDLERLLPIAHHAEPLAYYDYLNSLAVELGEVGRTEEARNICEAVLASPFAFAYPEWQETEQDLRGYSRSFVALEGSLNTAPGLGEPDKHSEANDQYTAIGQFTVNDQFAAVDQSPNAASNVLFMPAPEHHTDEIPAELKQANSPARVFNIQQWKTKVVKEPNGDSADDQCAGEISDREMLLKIVELASTDDLPEEALGEMVEALETIVKAHKQKET